MYVRDAWYMAAWDKDIAIGAPTAQSILNEPIVLYRTSEGVVVALEDRCVHRLAPLSAGRCEGANLRCMYHGLVFDPAGACVSIPGQDRIPPSVRVRAYPVAERFGAVWVWMGEADQADEALLPPFTGYHDPAWAMLPGRLDYETPASLIVDNLLDLSHIAFVHLNSFAGGNPQSGQGWIDADMHYTTLPRGVRVARWMKDVPDSPAGPQANSQAASLPPAAAYDVWTYYDLLVPGIFLLTTQRYAQGSYSLAADGSPIGEPTYATFTCQAVTPVTDTTASSFFAFGPWAADAGRKQFFADLAFRAFDEDRQIIAAQHQTILNTQNAKMMPLIMDKAVLLYEAVIKRLNAAADARGEVAA